MSQEEVGKSAPGSLAATERARLQRAYGSLVSSGTERQPGEPGGQPLRKLERNGELLLLFPDSDRHERRIQRAVVSPHDRFFWITVAVACGSPGRAVGGRGTEDPVLAKEFGLLEVAHHDLDAFYQYYRPMMIGSPFVVGVVPGLAKSPGFFDSAVYLDNPTVAELRASIEGLSAWIAANQEDPEYTSFQFNFCFSGHGEVDGESASIILSDKKLPADDLAALLLRSIPADESMPGECRLDLYLDCCRSGAVAHALSRELSMLQRDVDPEERSVLKLGQIYCACLDDEQSYELDDVAHGIFTFAFLNECSRRQPDGAAKWNLGLRDIGWHTRGLQHPLLLDFTVKQGINVKFPSLYHVPPEGKKKATQMLATFTPEVDDPVGEWLARAGVLRDACASVEKDLWRGRLTSVAFSRDEILTSKSFPFL